MSDGHGVGNGARLRLARQARGFSQQQLATMAGVSRQAVSAVESGQSDPSLRAALRLTQALGMTVEEVFGSFSPAPQVVARPVSLMSLAADDADLPADPEFRAALVGYLEWGTRLAMHNSQPGADVVQQAPVPRWGWGVAPPYQP